MFLIIGANGSIGQQLVKQLQGEKVRVLVRDTKKASALKGVEVVQGDVNDPASLDKAFQGVTAAFVLTANDGVTFEKNAFAAAKKAGTKHVVKLSVAGAAKGSPIRLGDIHGHAEEALKQSGVPFTILQPTYFMPNMLGNAGSIKAEGKFYGAMKQGRLPVIDVADIAASAAAILKNPAPHAGQTYYLTGPEALTQAQLAEKIGKAIGKTVTYVDVPPQAVVDAVKKMGAPDWLAQDYGNMHAFFATDAGSTVSDAVQKITGRAPRTFDAWLTDNAQFFK